MPGFRPPDVQMHSNKFVCVWPEASAPRVERAAHRQRNQPPTWSQFLYETPAHHQLYRIAGYPVARPSARTPRPRVAPGRYPGWRRPARAHASSSGVWILFCVIVVLAAAGYMMGPKSPRPQSPAGQAGGGGRGVSDGGGSEDRPLSPQVRLRMPLLHRQAAHRRAERSLRFHQS